jgi:hypothetical protein
MESGNLLESRTMDTVQKPISFDYINSIFIVLIVCNMSFIVYVVLCAVFLS